ncbi:hypothetical protein GCM10023231_40250 [Olivibacter ginsenosidimutans]|uniref:Efflux RND transporter periplasmic adaptor subunit n=2 Tax=Olivibacter ginsenosidimutans TaxID=1176537 RepID=A0ABP9C9F2_9SPHI
MDLVPFDRNKKDKFLTLNAEQQALAHISTAVIGAGNVNNYTRTNGRLRVNPEESNVISSRNAGRIEQLYVKETGTSIRKGQALFKGYSEQLLTLQQELLMTHKQAEQFTSDTRFQDIFEAAKQKLLLYGQTQQQLSSLLRSGKASPYITFYAPSSGVVSELLITEGQYVAEGDALLRLEGYHSMWVEADIYPREASLVKEGQKLTVFANGNTEQPLQMEVQFISPAYQESTQLLQLRGTIANPDNKLQAGMPATILLPQTSSIESLSVPSNAIIRSGKSSHVWIALGKEKFEPRIVETGAEAFDRTAITSGLKAGDNVVISGAYLLYSEYVLKKGGVVN